VHEACEAVPKIGPRDFDELVDSIKAHGLLRPIEIDSKRRLIDGRSRLQACAVAEVRLGEQDIRGAAPPGTAIDFPAAAKSLRR
jgi:hypothetical protein